MSNSEGFAELTANSVSSGTLPMESPDKQLLEFVARLVYNIEGLSHELKLYFNQYLSFHFGGKLSINQIQDIENRKASKTFTNDEEIAAVANEFSIEQKAWVIVTLQLLQAQAEKTDDRVVSRRIQKLCQKLSTLLQLDSSQAIIHQERQTLQEKLNKFQNRPVVKIGVYIMPLTIDYCLRWLVLLALGFTEASLESPWVLRANFIIIPAITILIMLWMRQRAKRKNKVLFELYGGEQQLKPVYQISASQYTWLAIYVSTSLFISQLLPSPLNPVSTAIALVVYYFLFLRVFRFGRISENDLVRQLEKENLDTSTLTLDENDEVIVQLETKLNASTGRLEAYVLESALFGALSFSGFLQIMSTELISFTHLENFASYIFHSAQAFIQFDWTAFNQSIAQLSTKESLFCLVSVESLVCSIFFLAVIASRLRFSDIGDRVRTAINLAKAYNEKEEGLSHETANPARLNTMTTRVNDQLHIANQIMEEITPVMTYMIYFRNAGILVFVIILITSGLFITGTLSWIFIALVMATYFYFNWAVVNHKLKALLLNFRIQFVKHGYWIFVFALSLVALAYILRIYFHVWQTDILFPLSSLLIGLYIFSWLILAAHVDERFGEIEMDSKKLRRWNFVKNTVAVLVLIFQVGFAFKQAHFAGANELVMIATLSISLMMYAVGYYLTKVRWLGFLCGSVIGIATVGILFKILHLDGANEMIFAAFIAFMIFIPIIIWKRELFHALLLRFCVVGFLVSAWHNPVFHVFPLRLQMAYAHGTDDLTLIRKVILTNSQDEIINHGIQEGLTSLEEYKKQYGTRLGYTGLYARIVSEYAEVTYYALAQANDSVKPDTTLLPLGLQTAREVRLIMETFQYQNMDGFLNMYFIGLESNTLLALGHKEQAIQALENILPNKLPDGLREALSQRITELKAL